jgi:hypothetical protein
MEEHFAGNCATICDNPAISNELKTICDTGSQQYCTSSNNIYKPECKAYLTRVVGNAAADRTGKLYANPIRIPVSTVPGTRTQQTAKDYYQALAMATIESPTTNTTLMTTDTADLIQILKDNNPDYSTDILYMQLVRSAFDYCSTNPNPDVNFCSETATNKSWAALEFDNIVKEMLTVYKDRATIWKLVKERIVTTTGYDRSKLMFTRMPNTFKPLADAILGVLTKDDLIDPDLIKLRSISPYMQSGVDTFVINLINAPKVGFARERLAGDAPMYNVALTNAENLYGTNFRTFFENLKKFNVDNQIISDPFVTLVNTTDNTNVSTCSTGNPLTNPMCAQLSTATGGTNATNIFNATVTYCSDANNVKDLACLSHINTNPTVYNLNDVNTKMLNYCLTTDGQNDSNCKPFSTITGSNQWLIDATKNTTDAAGVTTTVCGTTGNLSKDVCQNVCTVYPSICASDREAKCSTLANRYSTNVDFFDGDNKEEDNKEDFACNKYVFMYDWILYLIFFIVCAGIIGGIGLGITEYFDSKKKNTPSDDLLD